MAKKKAGGIPHPTLDKPKNMPGSMPLQNKKFSGGKGPKQGGGNGAQHSEGGDFGGDKHGLHGGKGKGTKMTPKDKKKK